MTRFLSPFLSTPHFNTDPNPGGTVTCVQSCWRQRQKTWMYPPHGCTTLYTVHDTRARVRLFAVKPTTKIMMRWPGLGLIRTNCAFVTGHHGARDNLHCHKFQYCSQNCFSGWQCNVTNVWNILLVGRYYFYCFLDAIASLGLLF